MQPQKIFYSVILSAVLLLACTGNSSATNDKGITTTDLASAGTGKDMYYEYTTSTTGRNASINGITKMSISSKGDMRVEMNMNSAIAGNTKIWTIVVIGHSDKPDESISIDDEAKTYSVNHFNRDDMNTGVKMQSIVTKVGEEKIMGFNCIHARVTTNKSIGSHYSTADTLDLWKSNEIPMPVSVRDLMDKFESKTGNLIYSPQAVAQLKQIGCEGILVKLMIHSKASTKEELTKVEHRDLPENIFQIPAGYKEEKDSQ